MRRFAIAFSLAGVGRGDGAGVSHFGGAFVGGLQAGSGGRESGVEFEGDGQVLDGPVVAFGPQGLVAFEVGGVAAGQAKFGGEGGVVRELGLAQQCFFKVVPGGEGVADGQGVAARANELLGGAGRQEHGEKKKDDEGARGVGHGWVSTLYGQRNGFWRWGGRPSCGAVAACGRVCVLDRWLNSTHGRTRPCHQDVVGGVNFCLNLPRYHHVTRERMASHSMPIVQPRFNLRTTESGR